MAFIVVQNIARSEAMSARSPTAVVPPRIRSKKSVESAWAAWKADDSAGSEFLEGVLSWTQGTTAQLLRPLWPAQLTQPSAPEIEERLREKLAIAVRDDHSTYQEALEWARRAVIEELRQARSIAG